MKDAWQAQPTEEEASPFWWLRFVPTVVVSALVLYFLYVIAGVAIVPVLASFGLAYLLDPIAYYGERRGLSRTLASLGAILLVALVATGFLAYVLPELWDESARALAVAEVHARERRPPA